jgi:hypothetical protein
MLSTATVLQFILMKRREKNGLTREDSSPLKSEEIALMEKVDSNV